MTSFFNMLSLSNEEPVREPPCEEDWDYYWSLEEQDAIAYDIEVSLRLTAEKIWAFRTPQTIEKKQVLIELNKARNKSFQIYNAQVKWLDRFGINDWPIR